MIQVYVLVSFWDDNGLHKAGTFTEIKEEDFNPYYMQKVDSGSGDAYTKAETDALLDAKQDDLTAGTNIQISDQDVISATDTGDTVQVLPLITAGTQIANIKINGSSNYVFAPEAEGSPFVIHCGTNIYYLLDGQSYPNQLGFSSGPIPASDLEDAVNAKTPVIIEFPDGVIPVTNIFIDADDGVKGSFVVGSDTNDGNTDTSLLKIITFQLRKMDTNYISMYVQDATPSGGGGGGGSTPTTYNVTDDYGQAVEVSAFLSSSLSTVLLKNASDSAVNFNTLKTAYLAGEVIIHCGSQWSQSKGDFKVIGVVDANTPLVTLLCSASTGTVNRVVLAWQGDKWGKTVNQ